MASIEKTSIKDSLITLMTVSGVVTYVDVIDALDDFYRNNATHKLLWDLTDADVSKINKDSMELIIKFDKTKASLRKNGMTALVANQDLSFGLSRMYEALSEANNHSINHGVFRSIDEAREWFNLG